MSKVTSSPTLKSILPASFLNGYASASYQIEGGYKQGGRGPSVWDTTLNALSDDGKTPKFRDNGNEACDSYNLWKDDVELLKRYGASVYRFSISWSRVIPLGGKSDPINQEGLDYYSKLIDALLAEGITPFITLYHWDLPQNLEDKYSGFLASSAQKEQLLEDFERFADVCFNEFGEKCKHWITLNEPHIFTMLSSMVLKDGKGYNVEVDPWRMGNNLLLAHARAVDLYRKKYQSTQKGTIGITLNCDWVEPFDDSDAAKESSTQANDLVLGWFADPVYFGKHNATAKRIAGDALEDFTSSEWAIIKGSSEFFGLNHYGTKYGVRPVPSGTTLDLRQRFFGRIEVTDTRDGKLIGPKGQNGHPYNVPWGFQKLLNHISSKWTSASVNANGTGEAIPIYVTENGWAGENEASRSFEEIIDDKERQDYYEGYLEAMFKAITEDGVDIRGYMAWSLMDNLEWSMGYDPRFGCTYVDRENGFKRTPKKSTELIKEIFDYAKKA